MKRSPSYESSFERFEKDPTVQRFVGRIHLQAEQFAHLVLGCSAEEFSAWLGTTLIGIAPQFQLHVEGVSHAGVQRGSAEMDKRLRQVEMGGQSHRGEAHPGGDAPRQLRPKRRHMTEEQKEHLRIVARKRWAAMSKATRTRLQNKMLKARREKRKGA